ncbi:hypothetical protein [Actinomycetospora succinea]|uniref:hypothetical protein n=1 Tax=Actinomycetospora succinea TaxID=663603 RepID=UPI001414FF2B|nr:hypothetical protein [Actinomycetospora succinea]
MALSVLLAVISWHTAWNLGGLAVAAGYALAVTAAMVLLAPLLTDALGRAPALVLPVLVTACVAALVVAFVAGVPAAYGDALGVGSDRADALNVALSQLAQGHYPYTATTYLGNPITPLPGALLLAAPFWWITGNAAWQNLAWLLLLLPLLHGGRRLRAGPTVLWVLVAFGGLEVIREFAVGDDLVTGAVPAVAAVALVLRAARRWSPWGLAGAAVVLGVATCTRPHMVLVVVIVVAAAGVVAGARQAAVVGAGALLVWAALVVPFLLGGTTRFSPLHTVAKVTGDRAITVGIVVIALGALALLLVALRVLRPSSPEAVAWACASVLFAPSVLSLARRLLGGPAADVDLTLGAAAVPFAVWAVASAMLRPPPTSSGIPLLVGQELADLGEKQRRLLLSTRGSGDPPR